MILTPPRHTRKQDKQCLLTRAIQIVNPTWKPIVATPTQSGLSKCALIRQMLMNRNPVRLQMAIILLAIFGQTAFAAASLTVSPSVVSNTYSGPITLQISGLTSGDSVVVQKYLDANTNGVIDAGDRLWQQFNLTDGQAGMVIGGVTNINVPGDTDTTAGQITAKLNFSMEFSQTFAGNYLFKVSSPSGHFVPVTNSFVITNFFYPQKFTGTVVSNGVAVPNASVLLFPAAGMENGSAGAPVASAVANDSGVYSLPAPAGTYSLGAFKSGFVADLTAAAGVVLGAGATVATNLTLIGATQTISGRVEDVNNAGIGLPGILGAVETKNGLLGICFTDTNGNFTVGVNAGDWKINGDSADLALHGYVGLQSKTMVDTTTGSVAGVTIAFPKGTALFYGAIKDSLGNPLPGEVAIYANDNNDGLYQTDGYADTNGEYVTVALGGLGSSDPWSLSVDNQSSYPSDIFSQPAFDENGGTNIAAGQAILANFTALAASNSISGNVTAFGANFPGVGVSASGTINGVNYSLNIVDTDSNGDYSLTVGNGYWSVAVSCQGGSDSLDSLLGAGNYQCPENVNVTITNNNGTANFAISAAQPLQITTASLSDGTVGIYYQQSIAATGGQPPYQWFLPDGTVSLPPGVSGDLSFDNSSGTISGTPGSAGTYSFPVAVSDSGNPPTVVTQQFSITIQPVASPLQITTTFLNPGTNGSFYTQTIQVTGGQPPYTWFIPVDSAEPPPQLTLATNGVLSGTLTTNGGPFYFDVDVTDGAANTVEQLLSVYVVNPVLPLVITNASLPAATVGASYHAQLGVTGGQAPYSWQLALGSANPPEGLTIYSSGLVSGIPATNKPATFKVQVTDANSTTATKVLSIVVNPIPVLASPAWVNDQFQMQLVGATNQNYTLQVTTSLSSPDWISVFSTNSPAASTFRLVDPNATNQQRFYRVLIGP